MELGQQFLGQIDRNDGAAAHLHYLAQVDLLQGIRVESRSVGIRHDQERSGNSRGLDAMRHAQSKQHAQYDFLARSHGRAR